MRKSLNEIHALICQAASKIKSLSHDESMSDFVENNYKLAHLIRESTVAAIAATIKPFPEISAGFEEFRFRVKGEIVHATHDQTQAESKWAEFVLNNAPFEMVVLYDERFKFTPVLESSIYFNCCTNGTAPDWSQYDALELGGCVDDEGDICGGQNAEDAEFFTIYGHLKTGGVEAITDIRNPEGGFDRATEIANDLSKLSGLSLNIVC